MSDLVAFRAWCRKQAAEKKPAMPRTIEERELWTRLADEVDRYLAHDPEVVVAEPAPDDVPLFEETA